MTDVLFLSPPRRADGSRALFNNASLTLASYLVRHGVEARVEPLAGPSWRGDLAGHLDRHRPRYAAISCKWWDTLYGAGEVARLVREFRPGTYTVAGGQTASSFARDLVERGPFDAVIRGDGERPLLDLCRGQAASNITRRRRPDGAIEELPLSYVQRAGDDEALGLLDDLTAIADERFLHYVGYNAPFIWTGKGCQSTCLFCGGSALGHKTLFGRTGYAYRPLDQVLHDMEVFGRWSGDTVMFDFDPVTDPTRRQYYRELLAQLPRGRYHAAFYCWSLPDAEFVEEVAAAFRSCIIGIDAQTYSEPLRQRLAKRAWIKPFAADADIEAVLATCARLPNCAVGMYGIVGLATESARDVDLAERWLTRLLDRYGPVFYELQVTPLSIEPGALLARDPAKYGMVALRRTYDDYLAFTGARFGEGAGFHDAPYDPAQPHPYGVHQETDAPDRVWHDFRRLRELIDRRLGELTDQQAYRSLRILGDRVGVKLENRTAYQDAWRLIPWAASEALSRGIARLEVDASAAWINVPEQSTLELDERFAWVVDRVRAIGQAVEAGQLEVEVRGAAHQRWGALKQAGLRLLS